MFIDKIQIHVKAGNGGNGAVAFHREKFVARGGPDGGDGGRGGNVILKLDEGMNTLLWFRYKRKFAAENGSDGSGKKFHGKNGSDLVIPVPVGTIVRDAASGRIIKDMSGDEETFTICRGGRGGWGNKHFATATRQVPNFAKNGLPGEEKELLLELKLIADAGLVGLPSAGKSSLLAAVSEARPKIAEYHFTTLEPSLGVVDAGDGVGFVLADIPGLIEGASDGAGLGHDFLRHIERCRLLIQVIDASGVEGRAPLDDFMTIDSELEKFSPALASRPRIIALNKYDMLEATDTPELEALKNELGKRDYKYIFISAAAHINTDQLIRAISDQLAVLPPPKVYDAEPEIEIDDLGGAENVVVTKKPNGTYWVEGIWIDKLVGRVNFEDRESVMYFERALIRGGIIDMLRQHGCRDGDTVHLGGIEFDFID